MDCVLICFRIEEKTHTNVAIDVTRNGFVGRSVWVKINSLGEGFA